MGVLVVQLVDKECLPKQKKPVEKEDIDDKDRRDLVWAWILKPSWN